LDDIGDAYDDEDVSFKESFKSSNENSNSTKSIKDADFANEPNNMQIQNQTSERHVDSDELNNLIAMAKRAEINNNNNTNLNKNKPTKASQPTLEYNNNDIYDYDALMKEQIENFNTNEFNPFYDVPNEIFSPFLHYSTIPPPENFQANSEQFKNNSSNKPFGNTASINNNRLTHFDDDFNILTDSSSSVVSSNSTNNNSPNKISANETKITEPFNLVSSVKPSLSNASDFDAEYLKMMQFKAGDEINRF
jgi:hypothetical protein